MSKKIPVYLNKEELRLIVKSLEICEHIPQYSDLLEKLYEELSTFEYFEDEDGYEKLTPEGAAALLDKEAWLKSGK